MSEDTPRKQMLLQTMLVGSLAKHLADKASGEKNEEMAGGDFDPYGDYGDYGSDDEYGTEDIGNAKRAFGDEINFGMGAEAAGGNGDFDVGAFADMEESDDGDKFHDFRDGIKGESIDESLLKDVVMVQGRSMVEGMLSEIVCNSIRSIGKQTIKMVLKEEPEQLNDTARQMLLSLFE